MLFGRKIFKDYFAMPLTFEERLAKCRRYLQEEVGRTLGRYLNRSVASSSASVQLESESEAKTRIGKDHRIQEFPLPCREQAIEMVYDLCRIALDEAHNKLGLLYRHIGLNLKRQQGLLDLHERIMDELWPIALAQVSKAVDNMEIVPAAYSAISADSLREKSETTMAAKAFRKKGWILTACEALYLALFAGCALVDSTLTYLVIYACYEGTAWYFSGLAEMITLSMAITMFWAAHLMIRRNLIGIGTLLIGTAALGYLRIMIAGQGRLDATSLSLALINVLPIPVVAYLANLCLGKVINLSQQKALCNQEIDKLLLGLRIEKFARKQAEVYNMHTERVTSRHNALVQKEQAKGQQIRQRFLEARLSEIIAELRTLVTEIEHTLVGIRDLVLNQMSPTIYQTALRLAQLSSENVDLLREDKEWRW